MSELRGLRFVRALGWATLAAAPILLVALALVSSRPEAPPSLVTEAGFAAWVAGALAFGASLSHHRGAKTAARVAGGAAVLVVAAACGLLAWSSSELGARVVALDPGERAELERQRVEGADPPEARWVHPTLGFSLPSIEGARPAPEIARESEEAGGPSWGRAHRVYAWHADEAEIVADLSRAPAADRGALAQVKDEIARQLAHAGHVDRAEITSPTSAELEATLPGEGHALARVLLFRHRDRAYRLVVTVVTREPIRWEGWLQGVRAQGAAPPAPTARDAG